MKTRRTVTIGLVLAVVACAVFLGLHSFAQSGDNDISLPNWQKLKAPYDNDSDLWEKDILKKHATKYCITHRKKDGTQKKHCPKTEAAASQSLIVPVGSSSAPVPMQNKLSGVNVTQNITSATAADKQAIEATFDTTGL
jgi:hypothetical protein